MARCKGTTKKGKRCTRPTLTGEKFCKTHMPKPDPKEVVGAPVAGKTTEAQEPEPWTLDIPKDEFIEHLKALGIKADKSMGQEDLENLFEEYKKQKDGNPTKMTLENWDNFEKKPIEKKKGSEGFYLVQPESPTTIEAKLIDAIAIREHEVVVVLKSGPKWRWEL